MSKIELNNIIVKSIQNTLPQNEEMVPYLMRTLGLGSKSIYRRLRSEVVFTFNEIGTLSVALDISIDQLLGLTPNRVLYDVALYAKCSHEERYYQQISQHINTIETLRQSTNANIQFATNYLPYAFTFNLDGLTKFRYYKWMHQAHAIDWACPMANVPLTTKMALLQDAWKKVTDRSMIHVTHIFDRRIFSSFCKDIQYFCDCQLITDIELDQLQTELLFLIHRFEELALTGVGLLGVHIQLYLFSLNLETAYFYMEDDGKLSSFIQIQNDHFMESTNPLICVMHKTKIEALKRYSMLISKTAEMQCLDFFRLQRKHVTDIKNVMSH